MGGEGGVSYPFRESEANNAVDWICNLPVTAQMLRKPLWSNFIKYAVQSLSNTTEWSYYLFFAEVWSTPGERNLPLICSQRYDLINLHVFTQKHIYCFYFGSQYKATHFYQSSVFSQIYQYISLQKVQSQNKCGQESILTKWLQCLMCLQNSACWMNEKRRLLISL